MFIIMIYICFCSLRTSTRKPASIILSANGKDAKCKEGLRVLDDGWKDTFCLTVAINLFVVSSTAAVVDLALR